MKIGVLLINLGTPDSPKTSDVRKYLTQFLNDARVIDINPIARFILVNGIIIPFRASKSAKLYEQIWTDEGSPLLINSDKMKVLLQKELGDNYLVELGMRYQKPSMKSAIDKLKLAKVKNIILIPLYPQYASSSTGSTMDEISRVLEKWDDSPDTTLISKFHDKPDFIAACVNVAKHYSIDDYDFVLFSYHGLPESHITKGDGVHSAKGCKLGSCCNSINEDNEFCYRANCFETTRQLVKQLNIPEGKYETSFQSRLDDKWLKPYSDKVIEQKAKEGKKKILVFSPAFVADCLETTYEIGIEYNELFKKNGGEKVTLVPSLNDNPVWIQALKNMVISAEH